MGNRPWTNAILHKVTLSGLVDDAITVDGNQVAWTQGAKVLSNLDVTEHVTDLTNGSIHFALYDWPDLPNGGPNEVCLGNADNPFRIERGWWVPLDIRLEHVNTNGAPLVVNPSGASSGHVFTCQATVLPTNVPDSAIGWNCTNAGMSFVGGGTNGRSVQLAGTQPVDWEAAVTVQDSTMAPAKLHGTILEKKTVPVYLHIVRDDNGQNPATTVPHFQTLLSGANQVWEQAGIEFQLAGNVLYTNKTDWQEISTSDNWLEYGQLQSWSSHTGGIEVYCIENFQSNHYVGLQWGPNDVTAGLTIASNASARTLAHELGHACGLADIYKSWPATNPSIFLPNDPIRQAWLPGDWCGEALNGGYAPGLTQPQLLQRLLMYGIVRQDAEDLPNREVYGLSRHGSPEMISVGLSGTGTRTPAHW